MTFAQSFTDLKVWQEGHQLVLAVYRATNEFPAREKFGLTNQLQRAAVSITSNIAEGFERSTKQELVRFLVIARGSIGETQNQLLIAHDLGYLDRQAFDKLAAKAVAVHRLLNGFIRSLKTSIPANQHTS